jgi:hypothetical protein
LVRAAREIQTRRDAAIIDRFPTISGRSIVSAADDRPFLTDYVAKEIPGAKKVIIPDVLQRCKPCIALMRCMGPELAQGGHLRHRSNCDSYLVAQRTRI